MKQDQNQKSFWVNAEMIMQLTGWTKTEMQQLRKNNPNWYQLTKTGGYVYDAQSIPPVFLKKEDKSVQG